MTSEWSDLLHHDAVGYDPVSGTFHLRHDRDESSLSYTVLRAVASITGDEPHDLDPLSEIVDPDALERVFDPRQVGADSADGHLVFPFNGCHVRIFADGHLEIEPPGS